MDARRYKTIGVIALGALAATSIGTGAGAHEALSRCGSPASLVAHGSLTLAGAEHVLLAAAQKAATGPGTGSIAVVDSGGHLLMLHRLDGTFPASARVAEGKARTAAVFRKATRDFEHAINSGRVAMAAMEGWTPLQGGVPIFVDGVCVGAVGVSGAASADQDDEIARAGAAGMPAAQDGK